jgi:diacylglycerol kinase (ATP)
LESPHKGKYGLRRVIAATRYSVSGLAQAARTETSLQIELAAAAVMIPAGLWLGPTGVAKALLVGSVLIVIVVELLNSALEAAVDRVSLEDHPLAGRAKDIGAAAVMVALINAAAIWLLVLFA